MKPIENSILVQRPVADVFTYLNNYTNDPQWRQGVSVMTQNTPVTQVGTETHEVLRFMGSTYTTDARIVEVVPHAKVAFKSTEGPHPASGWRRVEAAEGGTRVTLHTEIDIQGMMALFTPLLRAAFSRQMRGDLQTLKQLLET